MTTSRSTGDVEDSARPRLGSAPGHRDSMLTTVRRGRVADIVNNVSLWVADPGHTLKA